MIWEAWVRVYDETMLTFVYLIKVDIVSWNLHRNCALMQMADDIDL